MPDEQTNLVRKTTQNTGLLLFGTGFRMVASFAFVLFAADRLGVAGFGTYSIGVHFFELSVSLAATGIGMLLTKEVAKWPRRSHELITSAMAFGVFVAILGMTALVVIATVGGFSPETKLALLISSLALIPATLSIVCEGALIGYQRSEFVAFAVASEGLFRTVASILAILLGLGIPSLFMILVISKSLQLYLFWRSVRRVCQWHFHYSKLSFLRQAKRWRIYAAETWCATIYMSLDVVFLSVFAGEYAVGLYSAASKIVSIGSIVARAYAQAVFPILSRLFQKSKATFHQLKMDTIRLMLTVSLPVLICVSYYSESIIDTIFTSGKYHEAAPILTVLAWMILQELLNPFLSFTLYACGKQVQTLKVAAISLVLNLFATYILVRYYDALGAAVGTVFAGTVATGCYLWFSLSTKELGQLGILFLRTCVAAAIVMITLTLLRDWNLAIACSVAVMAYSLAAILLKLIDIDDWHLLLETLGRRPKPAAGGEVT